VPLTNGSGLGPAIFVLADREPDPGGPKTYGSTTLVLEKIFKTN
jgi:hypothetical protein